MCIEQEENINPNPLQRRVNSELNPVDNSGIWAAIIERLAAMREEQIDNQFIAPPQENEIRLNNNRMVRDSLDNLNGHQLLGIPEDPADSDSSFSFYSG